MEAERGRRREKARQDKAGHGRARQGREGIVVCDTTSYVIVMGTARDRQHCTARHSTIQPQGRTCEKERGREIKAHQDESS